MNLNLELALAVAAEAHAGQIRMIGSVEVPFIAHPIQVMTNLAQLGEADEDILCAALLHDAVEDSDNREYVRSQIFLKLGLKVLSIVDELTLPPECADSTSPTYDKVAKYAHIKNLLANGSIKAVRVKLADRKCNIFDMIQNKEHKRANKYAKSFMECFDAKIHDRIANDQISAKILLDIVTQIVDL